MDPKDSKNLSISAIRIPCDPVVSPSEHDSEIPHLRHSKKRMKIYDAFCSDFILQGVNYTRQIVLKSLAKEWQLHHSLSFKETYKIVSAVSSTLLLNEIEIIYWSLLLKTRCETLKPEIYAYFTGYQTKCALNLETSPFDVCLNSIIPNFRVHFNNWQLVQDFPLEITAREMNSRLVHLTETYCKGLKDYELMVNQLMQIPKRKESIMSESILTEIEPEPNLPEVEDFLLELLQEAQLSPIDKL